MNREDKTVKKNKCMRHLIMAVILVFTLGSTLTVCADEGELISMEQFDADFYASYNPDVVEAVGLSEAALYDHYVKNGFNEGRLARKKCPNKLSYIKMNTFDWYQYAADNPDIAAVYGTDVRLLWKHYSTIGYKEGRKVVGTTERVNAYLKCCDIVNTITDPYMTDREKAKAIHDWLCYNVDYDYSFNKHSYYIEGPMLYGESVCNGYALAFNEMARIAGIQCEKVTGVANNGSSVAGHAWNKVYIDGEWSYIDVTWDDFTRKYNTIIYACFMVDETEMNRIHDGCKAYFEMGNFTGYRK